MGRPGQVGTEDLNEWESRADWKPLDSICCLILAVAAGASVLWADRVWGEELQTMAVSGGWFEADTIRVLDDMTNVYANHYRLDVHPLYMTFAMPVALTLVHTLGATPMQASAMLNSATAALWLPAIFATLRLIRCSRGDALLLSALAAVSSGTIFWFLVPETYPLGSLSILVCLLLAALSTRFTIPDLVMVLAAAFSLSITITNWMAGGALAIFHRGPRRACIIIASSLALVVGVSLVQKAGFRFLLANRNVPALMLRPVTAELVYLNRLDIANLVATTRCELIHSIVMPAGIEAGPNGREYSIQRAPAFSTNMLANAAVVLWGLILAAGLASLLFGSGPIRFRLVVGSVLLGQVVLHVLYGPETFLYILHFVPLLIIVAGLATLTAGRRVIVALALPLVALALINNIYQFDRLAHMLSTHMLITVPASQPPQGSALPVNSR